MDDFYLKFESKYEPLVGYKLHQKIDFYSSLCRKSYSNNIQSWMILSIQIRILSFSIVSIDRKRKVIKNHPIMVKFAHKLTSYHLFLDESIRSNLELDI